MRIAEVIGTVTLSRCHPSFDGASLRMVQILTLDNLVDGSSSDSEPLVVWDDLGTGIGHRIAISEGGEAAQPFRPIDKPVDAYNAAILDDIRVEPVEPQSKKNTKDNSPNNKSNQSRLF